MLCMFQFAGADGAAATRCVLELAHLTPTYILLRLLRGRIFLVSQPEVEPIHVAALDGQSIRWKNRHMAGLRI
jgi:hypothetical protein